MEVLAPDDATPPPGGSAVTIGAYDGVHLGHRHVLQRLGDDARARGLTPVVVTFDRHPATVVRPDSAPKQLTDLEQKLELLAACGVDRTLVVHFDRERADETAEEFVEEVLVRSLGARLVVVGEDFHFGHGRKGNVPLLTELGERFGFEVDGVALTGTDGDAVSSTRIRQLVAEGSVAEATTLLGRDHEVRGLVVRGDGRGAAELGIPTANVDVPAETAVPGLGIYAGHYRRPDGVAWPTAISVGKRPTFYPGGQGQAVVEAHLLDFDDDLYGEPARLSFAVRLREERRFDSVKELVAQMRADVDAARDLLVRR